MPFFLLSKDSDSRLALLSDTVFESRADALAELSDITVGSGFDGWDDEVFVFDVSTGMPVLLMRPVTASMGDTEVDTAAPTEAVVESAPVFSPAASPLPETEPLPESEIPSEPMPVSEIEVDIADDPESPAADSPHDAPAVTVVPTESVIAFQPLSDVSPVREDAAVFEAPSITEQVIESIGIEHEIDELVEAVDETWAEAVADTADMPSDSSLKEALRRTAIQMESEGIIAPESVGSSVEQADAAPSWPWDVSATEELLEESSLDGLEESGSDAESLIRAPGDDETMSVSRPVIMGDYAEDNDETAQPEASDQQAPESVETVSAPASETHAVIQPTPLSDPPPAESDFILDLEPVVKPSVAPGYDASQAADLGEMSCAECVYFGTCPHSEGGDPRTCGSFQWK